MTARKAFQAWGSSPLARGLPPTVMVGASSCRIIPARAGFTLASTSATRPRWDHPRSRGVYSLWDMLEKLKDGSSPLARGLHLTVSRRQPAARIIPARAGFTPRCPVLRHYQGDHPRSRGVYDFPAPHRHSAWGSSPLARGLRRVDRHPDWRSGIIPARAGFTAPGGRRLPGRSDHPRSRGVYCRPDSRSGSRAGSSPLARGLPPVPPRCDRLERIIPARAGFTWLPRPQP